MLKLNHLIFLGGILAIALVLSGYKENFELNPAKFPNKLLLADMYNVKPDPGLSSNDAHNQYLLNPNEFACGYNQASNNKKYWDTPCDGTAYPPNICGGLYEKKHFTKKKVCRPGFNCRRVGFYCSKLN